MLKKILKTGSLKLWEKNVDNLRINHPLLNLFWECTAKCNFNCLHCGSSIDVNYQGGSDLKIEEIKKAFQEISQDFDPESIFINVTGGEPLLRKDLFEVMEFAKNLGFTWGMVTNGYLVDDEVVKKMKSSGMESTTVSIDGLEEEHDYFRQCQNAYQKAVAAVRLLCEADFLKELNITTVIHKKNIGSLEKMYDNFIGTGINSWRITNIDPIGRAEVNEELLLSGSELRRILEFIKEKRKNAPIDVFYECGGFLGTEFEAEVRNCFFFCGAGITVGSILNNGDIFVCPNVPRTKKLIQGNVKKDRFKDVWDNKFKYFRDKKRTGCQMCYECGDWNHCLGNSMHLWDFKNNEPKLCHLRMIKD